MHYHKCLDMIRFALVSLQVASFAPLHAILNMYQNVSMYQKCETCFDATQNT